MKKVSVSRSRVAITLVILAALVISCEGIFHNPLTDKETGEKINLLIVDFNFFKTHLTCRIFDATTKQMVEMPVTVIFSGINGNDIVTFTGNRKKVFSVTKGQIELTTDPAVKISEQSPFDFAVTVEAEGYITMNKRINLLSEGKKSIDIYIIKESDLGKTNLDGKINITKGDTTIVFGYIPHSSFKSALTEEKPFKISYSMTLSDFLKLKDSNGKLLFGSTQELLNAYNLNPSGFMYIQATTSNDYPSWLDYLKTGQETKSVVLHILESGKIDYISVNGTTVTNLNGGVLKATCTYSQSPVPDVFGYSVFENDCWNFLGNQIEIAVLPYPYTIIAASDETLCLKGSVISFKFAVPSSFSITADIYDMNNKFLYTQNFSGKFPSSFTLENTPPIPVKLMFRNNNPAFKPLADLTISNLCTGEYSVQVTPADGYTGYQCVLKAYCPDNPTIAIAPSYNGEYRLKNSSDPWQGAAMTGGVVDLLGIPEQEYEYRILWENEWEVMSFFTKFNADGTYAYPTDSRITSEKMADGRTRVNISHTYKQSVCETMNW
jgi:hypothetical protein